MYSPVMLVLLVLIAVVFVRAAWNIHVKEAQSRAYLAQAQAQLDSLSAQEKALKQSVATLSTKQGMDTEIRSEYLVVKPGEQVAVIVDSNNDTATDTATTTVQTGFWAGVLGFFHL